MLQYITNENTSRSVEEQVAAVLAGGCRWIQLRMKKAADEEVEATVGRILPMIREHEATLILDDRVELAKKLGLDGVHIGKGDMTPSQARVLLGASPIIGVTANTIDDIELVRALDIDYIGLGPFRTTATKENLAPVIGLDGYRTIMERVHTEEIEKPVVAIGGIKVDDVAPLLAAGVDGIAVSGAIASAPDMEAATRRFIEAISEIKKE